MSVSYSLWRDIFKKCCHAKAFKIQNDPTRSASLINLFGLGRVVHLGANDVTRTHDLLITNQLLYRLSYTSTFLTACTFYHMSPWMSTKKFDDYYLFSCMKKCRIPAQAVDFFRFLSVVQNLHCYTTPKNTRCFRLSRPRRRSKFLHFRDNVFT